MPKLTIQDLEFEVEDKYEEGHTITANEAAALNQTRRENLRNNFAATIKSLAAKAKEAGQDTNSDDFKRDLDSRFAQYAEDYEFNVRSARQTTSSDPVEDMAFKMAKEAVREALRNAGHKLKDVGNEKVEELAEQYLNSAAGAPIKEQAARRVEESKQIAQSILGNLQAPKPAQHNDHGHHNQAA
jgi:hypothetical protein